MDKFLLDRLARLLPSGTSVHRYLRRGIASSHVQLEKIVESLESKRPFYIYIARGLSGPSLHLGNVVPYVLARWLQEVFQVPVVIHLRDEEKFLFSDEKIKIEEIRKQTAENVKDILSIGFEVGKTFVFSDLDYIG